MTNATLGFVEEMNAQVRPVIHTTHTSPSPAATRSAGPLIWPDRPTQASLSALKDGLVRKLPVKRNGAFNPIDVVFLVPGDAVFLRGGNVVPADCVWCRHRLTRA